MMFYPQKKVFQISRLTHSLLGFRFGIQLQAEIFLNALPITTKPSNKTDEGSNKNLKWIKKFRLNRSIKKKRIKNKFLLSLLLSCHRLSAHAPN